MSRGPLSNTRWLWFDHEMSFRNAIGQSGRQSRYRVVCAAATVAIGVSVAMGDGASAAGDRTAAAPVVSADVAAARLVLGSHSYAGIYGKGWGHVRPRTIYNGGAPSGLVVKIRWRGWGRAVAHGVGKTSIYRPGGGYYAKRVSIQLRASRRGRCPGGSRRAYRTLRVRVPARPGGRLGPWQYWSGRSSVCGASSSSSRSAADAGRPSTSLLAGPAAGTARTNSDVYDSLGRLGLDPTAVFPTRLPKRLADADVSLETDGDRYSVTWDRGTTARDYRRGYATLSRNPYGYLQELLRYARRRGDRVKKVRVAGTTVWHVCAHRCGYVFHRDHRTYGVTGIYFLKDPSGLQSASDQRDIIAKLKPVPSSTDQPNSADEAISQLVLSG